MSARRTCPTCGGAMHNRSPKDHRHLFFVIHVAATMWPETHPFQPSGATEYDRAENLRGWLLVEAGWTDHVDILAADGDKPETIVNTVRQARALLETSTRYLKMVQIPGGVRVIRPRSINEDTAGKSRFEAVRRHVFEIIEAIVGITVDEIKREGDAHA